VRLPKPVRWIEVVNTAERSKILRDPQLAGGELEILPFDGTKATVVSLPAGVYLRHWRESWLQRAERVSFETAAPEAAVEEIPAESPAEDDVETAEVAAENPPVKRQKAGKGRKSG